VLGAPGRAREIPGVVPDPRSAGPSRLPARGPGALERALARNRRHH